MNGHLRESTPPGRVRSIQFRAARDHHDSVLRHLEAAPIVVGVFADGRGPTDFAQKINPYASGQRVLSRKLWDRARENVEEMNFGLEMAPSRLASKEGWIKEVQKW